MTDARPRTHQLKSHPSDQLTLHRHCGGHVRVLMSCLRSNGLPPDPYSFDAEDTTGVCKPTVDAWQQCARDFFAHTEIAHTRCAAEVAAARGAYAQGRSACSQLEEVAMRCLGTQLRLGMSGAMPSAYSPVAASTSAR